MSRMGGVIALTAMASFTCHSVGVIESEPVPLAGAGAGGSGGQALACLECPGADGDEMCSETCNPATRECTAPDPERSPCGRGRECRAGTCMGGVARWSKRFGDVGGVEQNLSALASDTQGNVIMVGWITGTVDFGGAFLSGGDSRNWTGFVAKLDTQGEHLWSRTFGDKRHQQGIQDVVTDDEDGVILVGTCNGSIDFGNGPVACTGAQEFYVVRLDAAGTLVWSKHIGHEPNDAGIGGVAVDGSGNVLLSGGYRGELDLGGAVVPGPSDDRDAFIASIAKNGSINWVKTYGAPGSDEGLGKVHLDDQGNMMVAERYDAAFDLGDGPLPSGTRMFVARFDSAGTLLWSRGIGADDFPYLGGAASGKDGATYLFGAFYGFIGFDDVQLYTVANGTNFFLVKLTPTGELEWAKRLGRGDSDYAWTMAVDHDGQLLLAGDFAGDKTQMGGPAIATHGARDGLLAKLTPDAAHVWSRADGGDDLDITNAVAVAPNGDVLMGGHVRSETIDLGNGPILRRGTRDIFIARLSP